ncbi:UNVERIFIED_CONTAM: hypothetical protein RMT77_014754 [Armadillidium vulgare]
MSTIKMSQFEQLPNEILLKIFSNTSICAESLISVSKVSERFQNLVSSEDKLWKSKFEQRWPLECKKIECRIMKNYVIENWKEEVEDSIMISNKFEEILNSLSFQLYKFQSITSPILSSIFQLFNVGSFGSLIVLNELRRIINHERGTETTKLYYAKKVLYHVNYYLVSQELNELFKLPPETQCLEKGVYYLAKGLRPQDFLDVEYEEVSSKLDQLAYEVQSHLKTKNPNHPAASIELFSAEEPLENTKWSDEECRQIFNTIKCILLSNVSKYFFT